MFSYGRDARAQIVPPAPPCNNASGTTVTCTGDLQPGISLTSPTPYTALSVNNLNQDIAPGTGIAGISFGNFLGPVTIDSDTDPFRITTHGVNAHGIDASSGYGAVTVMQTGDSFTQGNAAYGIRAASLAGGPVAVSQTGGISTQGDTAHGIEAYCPTCAITVTQTGDIATRGNNAYGIKAHTDFPKSVPGNSVTVTQAGAITTHGDQAYGIFASAQAVTVTQTGDITTWGVGAYGIEARAGGPKDATHGPVTVTQTGTITTFGDSAIGINVRGLAVTVTQTGNISTSGDRAYGISASSGGGLMTVTQTGNIATQGNYSHGIRAYCTGCTVVVTQTGSITTQGNYAYGISAISRDGRSVSVTHGGDIITRGFNANGIVAVSRAAGSVAVSHTGSIVTNGVNASGILGASIDSDVAIAVGPDSLVQGGRGRGAGVSFGFLEPGADGVGNTLTNWGTVSALSGRAVRSGSGNETIDNYGTIVGTVGLGSGKDVFNNRPGGVFEARSTSDFGSGLDMFNNRNDAVVHTAFDPNHSEATAFVHLEQFNNKGLISLIDGGVGDSFTIANRPGGTNVQFNGSGRSALAVDTFLGGPGSKSDTVTVRGNTSGRTRLIVNNANPGPGQLNREGIPVVFVDGNVHASNFYLEKPIDTGFFDYDLVFVPTGSGQFELRSHPGGGAHILPHVVSATHETFHDSMETWFDRTADLRVLLARGSACEQIAAYEERARCETLYEIAPAIWARGSGSWFNFDDTGTTKANGKTYRYDLSRDLNIWQVESGIDFGKEDVLAPDDLLVLGILGGAVKSSLEFDALARSYELSNLEAGAYATYLRGGFFLDTLFKAFFGDIEPKGAIEFPGTVDTQTYGVRVDSGYRFGGFQSGPFVEPLATLAVSWTHIDDFSRGGNRVNFSDDEQVRGRLGMRAGTSMQVWDGATFEPFVVGSLWGLLAGEHSADLTSLGTTMTFTDKPSDLWGEVSAGVNLFNFSQTTMVFAKVDYTFGEDLSGQGGKAGIRIAW